jgi:hypothetical protein
MFEHLFQRSSTRMLDIAEPIVLETTVLRARFAGQRGGAVV